MKKILLFILFSLLAFNSNAQTKFDTVVFYEAKIIDNGLLCLIDSFLTAEKENASYYSDTMSLMLYFNLNKIEDKEVYIITISSFVVEYFYNDDVYGYDFYKGHKVYLSGKLNNHLVILKKKHQELLEHYEVEKIKKDYSYVLKGREKIYSEYVENEFDRINESFSQWIYINKNNQYLEAFTDSPCSFKRYDCDLSNALKKRVSVSYKDPSNRVSQDSTKYKAVFSNPFIANGSRGDFSFDYTLKDNKTIVRTFFKDSDTSYYFDRTLVMNIKYKNKDILVNKEFTKASFIDKFPHNVDDFNKYTLQSIQMLDGNKNHISFIITLCIPDTDMYYDYSLTINKDSSIVIGEIMDEEEEE